MISKLIIEIDKNKNYSNPTNMQKAFDKILNQGWLHFDAIQKGIADENR